MKTASGRLRILLTASAVIEAGAGAVLLWIPSLAVTVLLGASLEQPAAVTTARVAGVALLALGVACWSARNDGQSPAARGLVRAMLIYNGPVFVLFARNGIGPGPAGIGLWPAAVLHAAMAVWCALSLKGKPAAQ